MPLFLELRSKLLTYKTATLEGRKQLLEEAIRSIRHLNPVITDERAFEAYETMAFVATLINYADTLHRIEAQGYFDILLDFKMPELIKEDNYRALSEYFEFHDKAPQMRLKKSIEAIPHGIWKLFREAQKEQLRRCGKAYHFDLDQLDITHPPKDQLYPLPIQMMGKLVNEAVDRVCSNAKGEYRFAYRYGAYQLPGGGMVEITLERSQQKLLQKMLDEHLEEEHGNLFHKAVRYFDEIDSEIFLTTLRERIAKDKLKEVFGSSTLEDGLKQILELHSSNSIILARAIQLIDSVEIDPSNKAIQSKLLRGLRADLQVETFKLHSLYHEAFAFIMEHCTVLDIEQFGDVRVCGGQQISHSFLLKKPLENWFADKLGDATIETADDLTGSDIVHMSLLQALVNFRQVRFSHILIVLVHQLTTLKDQTVSLSDVWREDHYQDAISALVEGAVNILAGLLRGERSSMGSVDSFWQKTDPREQRENVDPGYLRKMTGLAP